MHRVLLGPRVFFSRLGALTATHHRALLQMLARFALVIPVRGLSNASSLISEKLGWRSLAMRHANRRSTFGGSAGRSAALDESSVVEQMGGALREPWGEPYRPPPHRTARTPKRF